MLPEEVEKNVANLYKELLDAGLDTDNFIVIGGTASVFHGIEEKTKDIDILCTDKKYLAQIKSLFKPETAYDTFITFYRNGIEYNIGLPQEWNLTKPYNAREAKFVDDIKINVRPRKLIEKDLEDELQKIERGFARINATYALQYSTYYIKHKTRLEKLKEALNR